MTEEEKLKKQESLEAESEGTRVELSPTESASASVYKNTMEALKEAETSIPEFSSSYDEEINQLYSKIVNRRGFQYSPAADPAYGAYREQYTREGKLAMRNSMGQAAALTGGYDSSYGQAVGQQQYYSYLQKLNDVLPELYSQAFQRYESEGAQLQDKLGAARAMEEDQYSRFRDSVGDARYEQSASAQREQTAYDRQQTAYDREADSFGTLMELISKTGYQPSEDELSRAGMSMDQAEALRNEYLRAHGLLPSVAASTKATTGYSYGSTSARGSKEAVKIAANTGSAANTAKTRR